MKKGIFLLLAIILGAFILHGCYSNHSSLRKGSRSGYPVGHDMHEDSQLDENNANNANTVDNGGYS